MEIAIYQIDPEKDEESVIFSDYEHMSRLRGSGKVDASIYGRVFEGTVAENGLEDVYRAFNREKPEGYRGRSLSVSDIVEVRDPGTGNSDFYYCDTVGFRKVDFEPEKAAEMKNQTIRVVLCEPGRTARVAEIGTGLEDLQRAVGGYIETYYPFSEDVCIVCNDEGKLNGMSPCRAIFGEDREVRDIIFGPFFICSCAGPEFGSLNEEQLERYGDMFRDPERYYSLGGQILAEPYVPAEREAEWVR